MKQILQSSYRILCLCLLAVTGFAQTPVVNYSFTGNASDASVNGNDAHVNGALLTQDRFGWANNAFAFDGVQSALQANNIAALNTPNTTVSMWVKTNSIPATGEVFLISFGGWQERFKVSLPNHGKLVWTTNHVGGISDMDAGGGNELIPGAWTHLAFVHDGVKDIIYMNGVQVAEKAVPGDLNSTSKPLAIGYNNIDVGNYFDGSIDEVQIYGTALTAAQIGVLYAAQNTPPTVNQGLVANYTFTKNAQDATIFSNHGQLTDVRSTTDRFGYGNSAYAFNGTSSEITASNSAQLNSGNTTVSFWVKPNSLPVSGEVYLMSFGGWQERWKLSLPNHGKVVWTTNANTCCSDVDAGGGNELKPGTWSHVIVTHDGTNDKIYMDGVLVATHASAGPLKSTVHDLGIGYNAVDGGNWFDGNIDDVQIYNYALDATEISTLHTAQATFPGTAVNLVANYDFSGNTNDLTQFANNAANGGATLTTDRFGYAASAYSFDGNDSLLVDNSSQLNSANTTVSFWVNVKSLPVTGEAYLLSYGGWQERWKISLPSHGKVVWTTNATSCCSDVDAGGGNELVPGTWTHVLMTHDGTDDKIYMNGALVATHASPGPLKSTKYPLGIGNNPIDKYNYFNGSLDEVQIYNVAMSASEIAALYAAQSLAPNITDELVADYTFSGNTNDDTPYHNHAQNNGAQLTNDRFGRANKAYAFDGLTDQITAANSPQLNSANTSVGFWINVKELPVTGEAYVLSFGGWQERWKISLPSHGKLVWTTNATSCCSDVDAGAGNELVPGVWKYVVMTHDGTDDKIYMNGLLVATHASPGPLKNTVHPLGIGYNAVDGGNNFNGSLDDIQIYNTALSDVEIALLYATQSIPPVLADAEAPTSPLNLSAVVTFNNVNLSWWDASDNIGVTAYNVYQDGVKVGTTTSTEMYLPGLTPLTKFSFGVSAVDDAGNESLTTTLDVTTGPDATPDTEAPSEPSNLVTSIGSNSVLLSWDASTDNVKVSAYVILVDGVVFDTISGLSILVNGLDPSTFYTFNVYAYDLAGNNSTQGEVTIKTNPPIVTAEPGLVAHYPFEGNANDVTPYANHGVIGGNPVFEPATHKFGGQDLKFDGDGDSVLAPNAVQLISDYATVGFWIRVDGFNPNDAEAYILDFGHWSQRWKVSLPAHHKIVWTTNGNNTLSPNFIVDSDSKDGNEMVETFWWYVTMVHDGTFDKIYVNGSEVNSVPAATKLNSTSFPLGMGSNPIEGGQYFEGALDEVKIYNKALTAAEIANLYEVGTTGTDEVNNDIFNLIQSVYPNPAKDVIMIKHTLNTDQALQLRVLDIQGRQVNNIYYDKNELPYGEFTIDVKNLATGTYFLNFVSGGKSLGSVKFDKL